jgi:hypothetical protein
MIIFGGFEEGERTNSVIIYNLKANVWNKIHIKEKALKPCPRSGHTAVVKGNMMYVFGGKADKNIKLNDLWAFNMQNHTWTLITPVDDVLPDTRSGHTACVYGDIMVIFGGIYEVTKELNDVLAYSFPQKRWVSLSENTSPLKITKKNFMSATQIRESSPDPKDIYD